MARLSLLLALFLLLAIGAGHAQSTSGLSGLVTDQDGHPIANAEVRVDSGQTVFSAADGQFHLTNVEPGEHFVTITAAGHHVGGKKIEFEAGHERNLLVNLTANGARPPNPHHEPHTSTFYVQAYPFKRGHHRYRVKEIEVYDYKSPSKHWTKYGWTGRDGPTLSVPCQHAILGDTHVIRITWRSRPDKDGADEDDELSSTFYRKFSSPFQTETFYNP